MYVHGNITNTIQTNGNNYTTFCARTGTGECSSSNFLNIWDYNVSRIDDDWNRLAYDINQYCGLVPEVVEFGGINYAPDGSGVILGEEFIFDFGRNRQ